MIEPIFCFKFKKYCGSIKMKIPNYDVEDNEYNNSTKYCGSIPMKIPNYDLEDDEYNISTIYMLDKCLEMLNRSPRGSNRAKLWFQILKKMEQIQELALE